jgi:hypothetical protein
LRARAAAGVTHSPASLMEATWLTERSVGRERRPASELRWRARRPLPLLPLRAKAKAEAVWKLAPTPVHSFTIAALIDGVSATVLVAAVALLRARCCAAGGAEANARRGRRSKAERGGRGTAPHAHEHQSGAGGHHAHVSCAGASAESCLRGRTAAIAAWGGRPGALSEGRRVRPVEQHAPATRYPRSTGGCAGHGRADRRGGSR